MGEFKLSAKRLLKALCLVEIAVAVPLILSILLTYTGIYLGYDIVRSDSLSCYEISGDRSDAINGILLLNQESSPRLVATEECAGMVSATENHQIIALRTIERLILRPPPAGAGRKYPPGDFQIKSVTSTSELIPQPGFLLAVLFLMQGLMLAWGGLLQKLVPVGAATVSEYTASFSQKQVTVICILLSILLSAIGNWLGHRWGWSNPNASFYAAMPPLLLIIAGSLLIPVIEEWFFRGVILTRLVARPERLLIAIPLSATFAFLHSMGAFGPIWLMLFFASLIFSVAAIYGGGWRSAAASHIAFNTTALTVSLLVGLK